MIDLGYGVLLGTNVWKCLFHNKPTYFKTRNPSLFMTYICIIIKFQDMTYICWQTILTDIKHTSYFSLCLYPYLSKVIAIHIELHVGKWCQWHHNIEVPVNISTISAGGSDPPFNVPSSRCLHLSDPAGLHLSGTPARRSSLPPQEEETAHPPWPIHSLFCSAVPPLTPGGPEGYFG